MFKRKLIYNGVLIASELERQIREYHTKRLINDFKKIIVSTNTWKEQRDSAK